MFRTFYPAAFWTLLIIVLLCIPGTEFPKISIGIGFADKIVHIFLFSLLQFFWGYFIGKHYPERVLRINKYILAGTILFGIMLEFVQGALIPNRSFEFADIVADSIGALCGYLLIRRIFSLRTAG